MPKHDSTPKIAGAFAIPYQSHFQTPTCRLKFQTRRYKRKTNARKCLRLVLGREFFALRARTQMAV